MNKIVASLVFLTLIFVPITSVQADFDLESEPVGSYPNGKVFSRDGLSLVVTTPDFANGWIHVQSNATTTIPAGMGSRAIGGFQNSIARFGESTSLRYEFSQDISFAEFVFGDAGLDDDGTVSLNVFDRFGTSLATYDSFYGTSSSAQTIQIPITFRSAVFKTNGVASPNSMLQEWRSVTAIPEPSSCLLALILALFALNRVRQTIITDSLVNSRLYSDMCVDG
jgi:hypothetical protein